MDEFSELKRIFSDAQVKAVDWSHWDSYLSLLVLADHLRDWHGRMPMLWIAFEDVRHVQADFHRDALKPLGGNQHYQWLIDGSQLERFDEFFEISITASFKPSPALRIRCGRVSVFEVEPQVIDRLAPNWNMPSAGLTNVRMADCAKVYRSHISLVL